MSTPAFSSSCLLFSLLALRLSADTPLTSPPVASESESPARSALSSRTSSALSAGITFQPPPTSPISKTDLEPSVPVIIRLPEHVVEGERSLPLSDRDLHAPADLLKLSRRRYLGEFHTDVLTRFRIGGNDDAYALQRFADDERLQNIAAFSDKLFVYRVAGDKALTKQLEREVRWTFLRHGQF